MSKTLFFHEHGTILQGEKGESSEFDLFVNESLDEIEDFFRPLTQMDPEEDELFGETGRTVLGYRISTEDEPDGVTRDAAFSVRSDHIAAISIQSGKKSTSDAILSMGVWDELNLVWGVQGSFRVDASNGKSFGMESNYGKLEFDNDATERKAVFDGINILQLKDYPTAVPSLSGGGGFFSLGGVPYAKDAAGNTANLILAGGGILDSDSPTLTGVWTFNEEVILKAGAAPSSPSLGYGQIWYDSTDYGLWFEDNNSGTDVLVNLANGNMADYVFVDTATTSNNTVATLRSIEPTIPDKTYYVEVYILVRGTAGDFDNGSGAWQTSSIFFTRTDATFVRAATTSFYGKAYDGAETDKVGSFTIAIVDDSNVIKVQANGYTDASANTFEWKSWTRVWSV